jgi:hypothetical protein
MKNIAGVLALAGLVLGAALAPAHETKGCKKGTICRQLIEDGYKDCLRQARSKWRAIRDTCRQAKIDKNPALCREAINAGFETSPTARQRGLRLRGVASNETLLCPIDYPIDCGDGLCCPNDFPICVVDGCCPADHPIGCGTICCPSDFPICGDNECLQPTVTTTTTTTTINYCTIPSSTLPPSSCTSPGGICSTAGCSGLPSGVCELHCPERTDLVCVGYAATYSHCASDSDCPPSGAGFENFTLCVGPREPQFSCSALGICASPCP